MIWQTYQTHVVDFLLETLKIEDVFSKDEINRCIGIIRTNGVEARSVRGFKCRSVYPELSILSHSCGNCNSRCIQREDADSIEIRTQKSIEKGEEITFSYTPLLCSTRRRRKLLRDNWCFDCECDRCKDPNENNSNSGSLRCQNCDCRGIVALKNPLDFQSNYVCEKCQIVISGESVRKIEDEYDEKMNRDESKGKDLICFHEDLLEKAKSIFHENHFLVMRIKSQLLSHYGNVPGFFYHELSNELIDRKIGFCEEFLSVYGRLDSGLTDWRGSTLFELATARMTKAQRALDSGDLSVDRFREELMSIIRIYDEVVIILNVETGGTYLSDLRVRARRHISEVKDLIKFSEFLV